MSDTSEPVSSDYAGQIRAKLSVNKSSASSARRRGAASVADAPTYPVMPSWMTTRPFLSKDFPSSAAIVPSPVPSDVEEQESILVADILTLMEGVDGVLLRSKVLPTPHSPRTFSIDRSIDPSLRQSVEKILPLCGAASLVVRFTEEYSAFAFGMVNQALCSAMRTIIKEFYLLGCQLEDVYLSGSLSLTNLAFYLEPVTRTFHVLSDVCQAIIDGKLAGGAVLSLLNTQTTSLALEPLAESMLDYLLATSAVPYFEMLEAWVFRGVIRDPYGEFMVQDNKDTPRSAARRGYSHHRYTLSPSNTPSFLEPLASKILSTGKYLNVAHECGRPMSHDTTRLTFSSKPVDYCDPICEAHKAASQLLLNLLIGEHQLVAVLHSIKRFFLLDQGDFLVQFMDVAEAEMKRDRKDVDQGRLDALLSSVISTSTARADPNKEQLRTLLLPYDVNTQLIHTIKQSTKGFDGAIELEAISTDFNLSVLEAFTLDFVVQLPLSLVINRTEHMVRYQILFRHLFYCKHVERLLCGVWRSMKSANVCSGGYALALALRQRMLHFIQNLLFSMMHGSIETGWTAMVERIGKVESVDELTRLHLDFLNECLLRCMLTKENLLRSLHKILFVCVSFCNYIQKLSMSSQLPELLERSGLGVSRVDEARIIDLRRGANARLARDELQSIGDSESFDASVGTFDRSFTTLHAQLIDDIVVLADAKLMDFVHRLDYSRFYAVSRRQ